MRLKFLCISDAHLGESTSMLTYAEGRRHLADVLRDHLGDGGKVETDRLILLGDIPERSHATPEEMLASTHGFMDTLNASVNFEKAVYLPGNHDHVLWTNYCKKLHGENATHCITGPEGDGVVRRGTREDYDSSAQELLSIIFENPSGTVWQEIERKKLDVAFANPVYAERFRDRTYVFAHGTHFRKEATSPRWARKIADFLIPAGALGDFNIESEGDVREARNLQELESTVAPFMDALLPEYEKNPVSGFDEVGYAMAVLSGRFGLKRHSPNESRLFTWQELPGIPDDRVPRLTSGGEARNLPLKLCMKYFMPHVLEYLESYGLPTDEISFVYGDTHDGGWGALPLEGGGTLRAYNCGGWVTYDLEDHPTCYVFAVGEDGTEYLLDVSFREVNLNGNLLLRATSDTAEGQREKAGNMLQDLRSLVGFQDEREKPVTGSE
ncbi:MAG: metallophosphoesterase [Rubrobacteraceae bacterium]